MTSKVSTPLLTSTITAALCCLFAGSTAVAQDAAADAWQSDVRAAIDRGRIDDAISILTNTLDQQPNNLAALQTRAAIYSDQRRFAQAVADLDRVVALQSDVAGAYYRRGRANFCAGRVKASISDFDRYIKLQPDAASRQWERGIALYYAGRYQQGAKQFALYQKFHNNDVENATWRFLCLARAEDPQRARKKLLPIEDDRRAPMMQIYAMYRGEMQPDEVLEAARAGNPAADVLNRRMFYAHLYIGLYYEALGKADQARPHILAAEQHKIGHYMWDVAHLHAERLRAKMPPE